MGPRLFGTPPPTRKRPVPVDAGTRAEIETSGSKVENTAELPAAQSKISAAVDFTRRRLAMRRGRPVGADEAIEFLRIVPAGGVPDDGH